MNGIAASPARPASGPLLMCEPVGEFASSDLEAARTAFQSAARCELRQTWQAAPSGNFAPATVRVGWRHNTLQVLAELADTDVGTRASGLNQRLWELGDAFEIFLRPEGQEAYIELQVAPNNQRLQLRYADTAALERARRTGSIADALIPGEAFRSWTWIEARHSRWHVLAEIPARLVCGSDDALVGGVWRCSFSRYDYTRGSDEPVISSTSPHIEANFHRQQEWGVLQFAPAPAPAGVNHDKLKTRRPCGGAAV